VGDEGEEAFSEEDYEWLQQLAETPLNLNIATREELERMPFLSDQQVMDIIEYRDLYGPIRSLGELRMVQSLDYQQLRLLPFFIFLAEPKQKVKIPSSSDLMKWGHHSLTATARVPFYNRKGDDNGYLGYKYRHWMKYEYTYGSNIKIGLTASQDAGEPFFADRNQWGYDTYNYYAMIDKLGIVQRTVIGKYRLSTGMGLILNTSFSLGKQVTLQNLGRVPRTLRPHTSRSDADYFQGAAATIQPIKKLNLTLFGSYRPIDATLNDDGTAATLIASGYHRTPAEMLKKNNTHLSALGSTASYRLGGFRMGANVIYTHFDRSLEPNRETLYRRHYAHGKDFLNASIDYHFMHHRFSLHGETATDGHGALATINVLGYQPASQLSLVALQRFYSYRYTTLYGHSFSDFGHVQNESGFYLGANWTPWRHWHVQTYVDYAYAPWARYLVSQSSHAWDFFAQTEYHRSNWLLQLRYRAHLRQRDNEEKTALIPYDNHSARLTLSYTSSQGLSTKTQLNASRAVYHTTDHGYMLSQQLSYTHRKMLLNFMAGYFHTDSYQSRIYVYERQLTGEFAFPTYYGKGMRLAFYARTEIGRHLRLNMRVGFTNYFDRNAIGTGLQQIDASHLTDLDLQLRWRF